MRCSISLKNISFVLSFIALSIGLSVLLSVQSHALSAYDNVIHITRELQVKEYDYQEPRIDITLNWVGILNEASNVNSNLCPIQNIGNMAVQSTNLVITENIQGSFTNGNGYNRSVNFLFSVEPDNSHFVFNGNELQLRTVGYDYLLGSSNRYAAQVRFSSSGYQVSCWNTLGGDMSYTVSNEYPSVRIFIADYPIVYPDGYEGPTIPSTFTPTPPVPDLSDDIRMGYSYNDKHLELWNTTPKPPLNRSTMSCRWIIKMHDDPYVPYEDKITDCNERIAWDFSSHMKLDVKFMILYDKTGDGVITGEEDIASIQRVITLDGSSSSGDIGINDDIYTGGLKPCLTKTGVDFQGCWDNVLMAFNMLSFGVIKLPSSLDVHVSDECRNLTVLNSWLHVNNPRVCPAFPKFVRDIITPFVSVGLGLLMIYYLTKRRARLSND